jgi:hypothetical protein
MAGGAIDIGGIKADLEINSGNVERGLAAGRKALEVFANELNVLGKQLDAGAIGLMDYTARMMELSRTQSDLATQMRVAYSAAKIGAGGLDIFNKSADAGATSAQKLGRGLVQLGYIADDVRYGFSAIVNNIAPLVQGLGGGAGLTGALQIAAVGAYELYHNWDKLKEALGDDSATKHAIQSIEGLRKVLKDLKDDAENTSFWDRYWASAGGYDPDAGKAAKAAGLAATLKGKEAAESEAKKMEGYESDQDKQARERYEDAIGESGGIDKHKATIGNQLIAENGAETYLDHTSGSGQKATTRGERDESKWATRSMAEEFQDLSNVDGDKLTDSQRTRRANLLEIARQAAEEKARELIADAAKKGGDKAGIASRLGGDAGDLVSGAARTKSEKKAAKKDNEDAADAMEKEEKREKAIRDKATKDVLDGVKADRKARDLDAQERKEAVERAKVLAPDAKNLALNLAGAMDYGMLESNAKRSLANRLADAGMENEDAVSAADDLLRDARKGTPSDRRRAQVKNTRQRKTGVKRQAEEALGEHGDSSIEGAIAGALLGGKAIGKVKDALRDKLKAGGVEPDKLDEATNTLFGNSRDKINKHLRDIHERAFEGMGRENVSSSISSVSDMTNRVQSGVNNKDPVKDAILESNKYLKEIVENSKGTLNVTVGP